jgi:flagellar biosynthetic protein FliR
MEAIFSTWLITMMRTSALMAVMPAFSMAGVPAKLRVALGALCALFITSGLPAMDLKSWSLVHLIMLMGSEFMVGLLLGFVSKMFFYTLDVAGSLIAMSIGIMMPSDINPYQMGQSSIPTAILYQLAIMILFTTDMHHWLFVGIAKSYEVLPVGQANYGGHIVEDMIRMTADIFPVGIMIAGPILTVSFVLLLLFSILGRAVPQMNVFSESFSVRILAGMMVLGLTCKLMAEHIAQLVREMPYEMLETAKGLIG